MSTFKHDCDYGVGRATHRAVAEGFAWSDGRDGAKEGV